MTDQKEARKVVEHALRESMKTQPFERPWDSTPEKPPSDMETVVKQLTDPANVNFTTEIPNPSAFAATISFANWLGEDFLDSKEMIIGHMKEFKNEMIPFDRKRATELISMANAASGSTEDKRRRELYEQMFGDMAKR